MKNFWHEICIEIFREKIPSAAPSPATAGVCGTLVSQEASMIRYLALSAIMWLLIVLFYLGVS